MGRARRYKFSSEASHRFERGVDFESIPAHLQIMTQLVLDICGGQAGPVDDHVVRLPERAPVRMRLARCRRVLGVPVDGDTVAQVFGSLGFQFERQGEDFVVTPPSARFDIAIEEDLIEEVARIYGFDRIPDEPPLARAQMRVVPETSYGPHAMRAAMAALDYQEVINFSFVEEAWERDYAGNLDPIRLLNPIASQLAVMRSSLMGGLLDNIAHNAKRKQSRVRVFELGRVFARDPRVMDGDLEVAGVAQPVRLAGAAWGPAVPEQWGEVSRPVDFFDVKRDLESLLGARAAGLRCEAAAHPALHPGRSARLLLDGQPIGWLGETHPRWVQALDLAHAPIVFEIDAQGISERVFPQPTGLSRHPLVVRDLAIWVDAGLGWQAVLDTLLHQVATDVALSVVKDIKLFDIWRDKNDPRNKSFALRFWFQGQHTTLDDQQIEYCTQRLLDALVQAHGVRLRS